MTNWKNFRNFRKKVGSRKITFSSWFDNLEISDFPQVFAFKWLLNLFYALFNHDVGMKSNLQVQGYLTHVELSSYDALNAS